jgi:hypothetical protein
MLSKKEITLNANVDLSENIFIIKTIFEMCWGSKNIELADALFDLAVDMIKDHHLL